MPKPKKERHVEYPPYVVHFKPVGIPMSQLDSIILNLDEYEAIRLADLESMKHNEASENMNVSRPTFTRLLESAHKKIADAIINGKAVKIEGGEVLMRKDRFLCGNCNHLWFSEVEPEKCPKCENSSVVSLRNRCCGRNSKGLGRCHKEIK
jgi:predicted DNA-binding protein (UPF0251 family)